MPQDRTRKVVVAGVLSAIAIVLGWTPLGFIPWFGGVSITILTVPVIIGAILEGPVVGLVVGLVFGLSSLLQANVAPRLPTDVIFKDPTISVLPRLFIGPVAWLVWMGLRRWPVVGMVVSGIAGALTNTILVLGVIGLRGIASWPVVGGIALANGPLEAAAAAILTLAVVAAWKQIELGRRHGAAL